MTATSNHGKMTFRYKPLNKLYGSRKKGDLGIFNNFKITKTKLNLLLKKRHWTLPREAEAHYSHSLKI